MPDTQHLYARGPYRVVELDDDGRLRPFVVIDTAGAWVHEDATLVGARDWVDRRVIDDASPPDLAPTLRPRSLR